MKEDENMIRPTDRMPPPAPYRVESNFFSDGTRKLSVVFQSREGERTLLFAVEDAIRVVLDEALGAKEAPIETDN